MRGDAFTTDTGTLHCCGNAGTTIDPGYAEADPLAALIAVQAPAYEEADPISTLIARAEPDTPMFFGTQPADSAAERDLIRDEAGTTGARIQAAGATPAA